MKLTDEERLDMVQEIVSNLRDLNVEDRMDVIQGVRVNICLECGKDIVLKGGNCYCDK